ncbi:permease YjgP/YjgQ family protein [Thermovirga lienii DSM 17291]|jgi:lipopolysaccharide export system permease protein|uniref:Permease YjgP/YjgQ family protein n=1 Tax=Thermovirga lienii (strain ATCC BAA-1197 / DSM 17291 / Cas60314) TaxID=580340 RepID=G7V8C5_THELD|nr:LPS export ABC transporter permease LptG [Thermovirga lienii]AER66287.1 permease YjgP/YjgQ family protein [Thermovirga lienii DSM 17291]MDN5319410.1 lipopolysaccharide export system permease protein [Thermovirga sp.]MDN5368094.1 lipopolysaccharide export system permease protein [Thermovirga sp.]HCD71735.1 LPS export ABC transporter permease LptG [Thermovirga lienii]
MSKKRHLLRTLDRYILSEVSGAFFFGIAAFAVLLVAGDLLFDIADLIVEKGVSAWAVAKLFAYKLPEVIVMTLPMASLLACLLTFSRLSSQSEIVALRASGVAFQRILVPILIAGTLVSMVALAFNETLVPLSNKAADNILRFEVAKEKPTMLKEKVFLREESGGTLKRVVYIAKLRYNKGEMEDVLIQDFEKGILNRITNAKRGYWTKEGWVLRDGKVFEVKGGEKVQLLFSFDTQKMPVLFEPQKMVKVSRNPQEMSALELWEYIKLMKKQGSNLSPLWVLFHLKLALPWACVILALLGTTLGVRPHRSGHGTGLATSVFIVFLYYVLMSFFKSFGEAGHLSPLIAAWMPNLTFFAYAFRLALKANG